MFSHDQYERSYITKDNKKDNKTIKTTSNLDYIHFIMGVIKQ